MKCANCGAKIKVGCVYCSVCGKEAQIVPDYNLEEDYFDSLLMEEKSSKKASKKNPKKKTLEPEQVDSNVSKSEETIKKSSKKGVYLAVTVLAVLLIGAGIAGYFYITSHSYEGRLKKAETAYANKEYSRAVSYAKQALEKDSKGVEAHLILGEAYCKKGEDEQAKKVLEDAVTLKKSNQEVYELLIKLYAKEENYTAIEELYAKTNDKKLQKLFQDYIVEVPEVEPEGGEYGEYFDVLLRTDEDADIYYTIDGSDPVKNGTLYEEPISLDKEGNTMIRAVCKDNRGIYSLELSQQYEIELDVPELPTAVPGSGTYQQAETITIDVPDNCNAYYAWNGTPDANATLYTGPFEMIQGNNVLSIILINQKGRTSGVQKYNYIYMP